MAKKLQFEDALKRLEEIIERLESGEAPLEENIKAFEEGNKLIQQCLKTLDDAEQKVQRLTVSKAGEAQLEDFQ